jgi:hypothetical protein
MREYGVSSIEYREMQDSKGAAWGNRIVSWGHMTEALIPVSGFHLSECIVSGGSHLPLPTANRHHLTQVGAVPRAAIGAFPA